MGKLTILRTIFPLVKLGQEATILSNIHGGEVKNWKQTQEMIDLVRTRTKMRIFPVIGCIWW